MIRRPPRSTLFPSTPLFRSLQLRLVGPRAGRLGLGARRQSVARRGAPDRPSVPPPAAPLFGAAERRPRGGDPAALDRKSTRLNSSHSQISYAVFCLNKKNDK